MKRYGVFSRFYDRLTFNVPYDEIAKYYDKLIRKFSNGKRLLDMGCGTGNLTVKLAEMGYDIIGQDSSAEMLTIAASKSDKVRWICQKMEKTELLSKADIVISTLDSINHLDAPADIFACFKRVQKNMRSGGVFIFDVNTPYKHKNILGNNTFVYELDGLFCVWRNTYVEQNYAVEMELDFFLEKANGTYYRKKDRVRELTMPQEEYCRFLKIAGLDVVAVYDYLKFTKPESNSEKIVIVAYKR